MAHAQGRLISDQSKPSMGKDCATGEHGSHLANMHRVSGEHEGTEAKSKASASACAGDAGQFCGGPKV